MAGKQPATVEQPNVGSIRGEPITLGLVAESLHVDIPPREVLSRGKRRRWVSVSFDGLQGTLDSLASATSGAIQRVDSQRGSGGTALEINGPVLGDVLPDIDNSPIETLIETLFDGLRSMVVAADQSRPNPTRGQVELQSLSREPARGDLWTGDLWAFAVRLSLASGPAEDSEEFASLTREIIGWGAREVSPHRVWGLALEQRANPVLLTWAGSLGLNGDQVPTDDGFHTSIDLTLQGDQGLAYLRAGDSSSIGFVYGLSSEQPTMTIKNSHPVNTPMNSLNVLAHWAVAAGGLAT